MILMGLENSRYTLFHENQRGAVAGLSPRVLGPQVDALRSNSASAAERLALEPGGETRKRTVGIPVAPFPRWMVCPKCRLLAPIPPTSDLFKLVPHLFYPDRTQYVHANCHIAGKTPALPARFLMACPEGTSTTSRGTGLCIEDSPAVRRSCDYSRSVRRVRQPTSKCACDTCKARRRMAEAFGRDNQANLPRCNRRRPHLRDYDPTDCGVDHMTTILQGASNSWFSILMSALSIPPVTDELARLVAAHWTNLKAVLNQQNVELLRSVGMLREFAEYSAEQVWNAIEWKRAEANTPPAASPSDLKSPEYAIFTQPDPSRDSPDFKLKVVPPPERYGKYLRRSSWSSDCGRSGPWSDSPVSARPATTKMPVRSRRISGTAFA